MPFFEALPRPTTELAKLGAEHDARVKGPATAAHDAQPVRHVVEPRHESFKSDEANQTLREHDIGLVSSDGAGE